MNTSHYKILYVFEKSQLFIKGRRILGTINTPRPRFSPAPVVLTHLSTHGYNLHSSPDNSASFMLIKRELSKKQKLLVQLLKRHLLYTKKILSSENWQLVICESNYLWVKLSFFEVYPRISTLEHRLRTSCYVEFSLLICFSAFSVETTARSRQLVGIPLLAGGPPDVRNAVPGCSEDQSLTLLTHNPTCQWVRSEFKIVELSGIQRQVSPRLIVRLLKEFRERDRSGVVDILISAVLRVTVIRLGGTFRSCSSFVDQDTRLIPRSPYTRWWARVQS